MMFYIKIQEKAAVSPASYGGRYPCYADSEALADSFYLLMIT